MIWASQPENIMTKIKTADLIEAALDWAVCLAKGMTPEDIYIQKWGRLPASLFRRLRDEDGRLDGTYITGPDLLFSRKWEAGGPIIEQAGISLDQRKGEPCRAFIGVPVRHDFAHFSPEGKPLVAAMRCFVASRLGDEVDIPDELLK